MTTDEFVRAQERSVNLDRAIGLSVPEISVERAVFVARCRRDASLADCVIATWLLGGQKAVAELYEAHMEL